MRRLQDELGLAVIAVSHDLVALAGEADHLVCINRRMHVHGQPDDVIHSHALREAYSCEFDFLAAELAHHEARCRHAPARADPRSEPQASDELMLEHAFMQRALVAALGIGVVCGALGFFVVLRRLAFVGVGISHAAVGGVALGLLLGLPPLAAGGAFGVAVALGIATRRAQEPARRRTP